MDELTGDRDRTVKLQRPTDFDILRVLDEEGRNVATNISEHLERKRSYINTRLPVLEDYGLVRKIGPVDRSGLYEITELGRVAVEYQKMYDEVEDFGAFVEEKLEDE